MNKTTVIGILLAVVVFGGGYLLIKNAKQPIVVVNNPPAGTTGGNVTPPATTPSDTTPTPGAPIVETSSNNATSGSTAVVTGQVNPNGASTNYWFEYGTTTAFGTQTSEQGLGSGYTLVATPAFITGLKANTKYYFRVNARNSFSTVNGVAYSFMTNNNPPPQGIAPTARTMAATDIARISATANGQVNPGGTATSYWFEYGKDAGLGSVTPIQSVGSGTVTSAVSFSLPNLAPLTKHYFRLNVQNQYGTVNGALLNFTTKGPAAAAQPTVTTTAASSLGNTAVVLNGRVNPNGSETTYWFEYSNDSLLSTLINSGTSHQIINAGVDSVNVKANVTGLRSNTTYYYHLVARNALGTIIGTAVAFKTK